MKNAQTVFACLHDNAARRADVIAIYLDQGGLRFGELMERIAGTVAALRGAGLKRGDRVLFKAPNSAASVILYFGIHGAGCVAMPIDDTTPPARVRDLVQASAPALFVEAEPVTPVSSPVARLDDLTSGSAAARGFTEVSGDDVADIIFTTGTSGTSKGVMLSHDNIYFAAKYTSSALGQRADDIEVLPIPMSHGFGLGRVRCMAYIGSSLVPMHGLRSPKALLGRLQSTGATGLSLVPSGFAALRRVAADDFIAAASSLRYIEIGSAPMDAETREWLTTGLSTTRILHHYGLTEGSRVTFSDLHSDAAKQGSIGRPIPDLEVEVRGDTAAVVEQGAVGELWIRGRTIMQGYLNEPELTADTVRDGWLRTGDLCRRTSDGYIYLEGRLKDLVNVGGLKVSPQEVEDLLCRFVGVKEVGCVGVPDPLGLSGERVAAFLVAAEGAIVDVATLASRLRDLGLESYKIPVSFELVDELPKTASGKLRRSDLRSRVTVRARGA